jgi:PBP1b-binding outer membrane lipoprotein LpoB
MRKLLIVTSLAIVLLIACGGNEQATPSSVRPTEAQKTPELDHQDRPPESHARPTPVSPPEATDPVAETEQVTILSWPKMYIRSKTSRRG